MGLSITPFLTFFFAGAIFCGALVIVSVALRFVVVLVRVNVDLRCGDLQFLGGTWMRPLALRCGVNCGVLGVGGFSSAMCSVSFAWC